METCGTEEPYEGKPHVRICGGAGWATTGSTRTAESLASGVSWQGQGAIPQKSPCQPNLLECSRLGTRFQVPILYALTLLARVSQVETLCPHRVSFALLPLYLWWTVSAATSSWG